MTRHVLLLALAACGPGKNANPTKAGTVVLDWKLADSDRASIRTASLSDTKTQTIDYTTYVDPENKTSVKLKIVLETSTVRFGEEGAQREHRAPTKVTVSVIDANDFTLANGKCMGPHYDMGLPPGRDMILHCTLGADKPHWDVGVTFMAYGDGRLDDGIAKRVKVVP